jgi:hypothetical protein
LEASDFIRPLSSLTVNNSVPSDDVKTQLELILLRLDDSILKIEDYDPPTEMDPASVEANDLMGIELGRFVDSLEELRRLGEVYIDQGRNDKSKAERRRWWNGTIKDYLEIERDVKIEIYRREKGRNSNPTILAEDRQTWEEPLEPEQDPTDASSISDFSIDILDPDDQEFIRSIRQAQQHELERSLSRAEEDTAEKENLGARRNLHELDEGGAEKSILTALVDNILIECVTEEVAEVAGGTLITTSNSPVSSPLSTSEKVIDVGFMASITEVTTDT